MVKQPVSPPRPGRKPDGSKLPAPPLRPYQLQPGAMERLRRKVTFRDIIELRDENAKLTKKVAELDQRMAELEKHNDISRTDKS